MTTRSVLRKQYKLSFRLASVNFFGFEVSWLILRCTCCTTRLHRQPPRTHAHNYFALISICRGGMGETHGNPAQHSKAQHSGRRMACGTTATHHSSLLLSETLRATPHTGPPQPGSSRTRNSSTKIKLFRTTCIILSRAQVRRQCNHPSPAAGALFFVFFFFCTRIKLCLTFQIKKYKFRFSIAFCT